MCVVCHAGCLEKLLAARKTTKPLLSSLDNLLF